jgi:hypothetical protein
MIWWILPTLSITSVTIYAVYCIGYVRGYKAGLAFGMEKLEEFHKYVQTGLRNIAEEEMREVVIDYHTKEGDDA